MRWRPDVALPGTPLHGTTPFCGTLRAAFADIPMSAACGSCAE